MCLKQLKVDKQQNILPHVYLQQKSPTISTKHTSDDNKNKIWLQHKKKQCYKTWVNNDFFAEITLQQKSPIISTKK